jgi:hypothetical protein
LDQIEIQEQNLFTEGINTKTVIFIFSIEAFHHCQSSLSSQSKGVSLYGLVTPRPSYVFMCVGTFLVRVSKTKEGIRSGKVEREKEVEESGEGRWRWNKRVILSPVLLCVMLLIH